MRYRLYESTRVHTTMSDDDAGSWMGVDERDGTVPTSLHASWLDRVQLEVSRSASLPSTHVRHLPRLTLHSCVPREQMGTKEGMASKVDTQNGSVRVEIFQIRHNQQKVKFAHPVNSQ
jgi:hypothetical protein